MHRWYIHDWNTLDNKIRSSIVEGVSVFLSMFDLPSVARVFCPPAPEARQRRRPADQEPTDTHGTDTTPLAAIALSGDLPPLDHLIERGTVLALNMPAGTNPALARAIGVMLKNAWLQSLFVDITDLVGHPMSPTKEGDGVQGPARYPAEEAGTRLRRSARQRPEDLPSLRHPPLPVLPLAGRAYA